MTRYCSKCGSMMPDGAAFCGTCGAVLERQNQQEPSWPPNGVNAVSEVPGRKTRPDTTVRRDAVLPPADPFQQQPPHPAQPKKKRNIGPIIGGVVVLVVIAALLGVVLSRSGSSSSAVQASGVASSSVVSQQAPDPAELMEPYVGTWKLASVSGMYWVSGESDAEDLQAYGIEVFLTLSEDGTAQLSVNGESASATWKVKNTGTASVKVGGSSVTEEGALANDQLKFNSGYSSLTFVSASAEEVVLAESADSPNANPVAIESIYDLAVLDTFFTEQPTPANGEVLFDDGQWKDSEITVTAPSATPCYVKLKDMDGNNVMIWWVDAGQTATVSVPSITGEVVYATGEIWYGGDNLFGPETIYRKPDEVLDLYTYTYEFTFQKSYGGNLVTEDIDFEDF